MCNSHPALLNWCLYIWKEKPIAIALPKSVGIGCLCWLVWGCGGYNMSLGWWLLRFSMQVLVSLLSPKSSVL